VDALVATDVAARGIDVQDIARVIHAEPPTDPDSYTHRSGRTGRAGKKGTSSVLVSPAGLARVGQLLRRSGARFRMAPIPTAAQIRQAASERVLAELTAEGEPPPARFAGMAETLAARDDVARVIARLLAKAHVAEGPEPREVRVIAPPQPPEERPHRPRIAPERPSRSKVAPERPSRSKLPPERPSRSKVAPERPSRARLPHAKEIREAPGGWVAFRFTWGSEHGADPRRLLAMACRRGGIRAADIGAIRVSRLYSVVNVAGDVAADFAEMAGRKDPRDPRVRISRERERP
jgi:ATP-dependent RNA helicase DeaD